MTGTEFYIHALRKSGEFDEAWYLDRYRDVDLLGLDPIRHYVMLGARIGRNPSPRFHTAFYLETNPDVSADGLNPLFHYVSSGRSEGRKPCPDVALTVEPVAQQTTTRVAQYRFDRNARISPDQDWVVFVAYSSSGALSDLQRYQIDALRAAGYAVALLVNTDHFFNMTDPVAGDVQIQIVRENVGFDFGAWRHAIELIGGLRTARSVTFTNDSILPVGAAERVIALRAAINSAGADVVFLTRNQEVKVHSQSYFFTLTGNALGRDALTLIADLPVYTDKDALIYGIEIHFADFIRNSGLTLQHVFEMPGIAENLTIHHWEALLDAGFPFLKIQLITAGLLEMNDPRLEQRLGADVTGMLGDHCSRRGAVASGIQIVRNAPAKPALPTAGLFNEHGAQQAWNLAAEQNPTIKVPLRGPVSPRRLPSILAIVHGFYLDVAQIIFEEIMALDLPMRLLVTTDTAQKAAIIEAQLAGYRLSGKAVVCPNRGRDLGPFVIEGAKELGDAEIVLHLHTKKSPHDSIYAGWGDFVRHNLIGSREIVLSILTIMERSDVGLVYSDHFPAVVDLRNWGFDFGHTQRLMRQAGGDITEDMALEFPTSSMFWARASALDALFAMGLAYDDFEEEAGQVDGTLAHGIERALLYLTEHAGHAHAKVTTRDTATELLSPVLHLDAAGLEYAFQRGRRRLMGDAVVRSAFYDAVPEIFPVGFSKAKRSTARLDVLLPTMKPEKIFGGITTALTVVRNIAAQLSDIDLRVLITSDTVDRESVAELSLRLGRPFAWTMPDDDVEGDTIVGIAENQNIPLSLRSTDLHIATAWWTADLGFRMIDRQREFFGRASRLAYIIQDYEPGFYAWSNTFALAEATYHRPDDTIAIINSEELANYMMSRYRFAEAYHVPYELHPRLQQLLTPTEPRKLILVYGRPGVSRNCFPLIVEALRIWQARNPARNCAYELVFAGEPIAPALVAALANVSCVGKLSIEDYALTLNDAAIGISLMVSPHPSYPPLEMASAGCVTITNQYESKDLRKRADNFISLEYLSPAYLADALDQAVDNTSYSKIHETVRIKDVYCVINKADYDKIATNMKSLVEFGIPGSDYRKEAEAIKQNWWNGDPDKSHNFMGYDIPVDLMLMTGGGLRNFDQVSNFHIAALSKWIGIEPHFSVVEIGCGIGRDAIPLTHILTSGKYIGIDIIWDSINWCKLNISARHRNFDFYHFDVNDKLHNPIGTTKSVDIRIPAEDNSVDRVFLFSVFTHLLQPEIVHYLKEFQRILKPGGLVYATAFIYDDPILASARATGLTPFDLRFEHEITPGCRINSLDQPLGAVAYTQDVWDEMVRASGMRYAKPMLKGGWSGFHDAPEDGQDVAILCKP